MYSFFDPRQLKIFSGGHLFAYGVHKQYSQRNHPETLNSIPTMETVTKPHLLENLITATDLIFESSLTLEQLSSIKILVILWNKKSIREKLLFVALEFTDSQAPSNSQIWREILRQMAIHISALKLPRKITEKLWDINNYISKSLLYWLIHTYSTFYHNSGGRLDPLTWKSYFYTTLNLFWNALSKSNAYEMKFCNDVETCTRFQNSFLALWYNIPKSLENRIHQDANMIALVLYFLPWNIGQHVIHYTIHKIEDSQKKDVITSKYGRLKCIYFIKHNEWQFYNLYTSYMLSNKEDLFRYKQYLINEEGTKTAVHFFKNKAVKNGSEFLQFKRKVENELDDKDFFISYFIKHRHWDLLELYLGLFCDWNDSYEVKKSLLIENGLRFIEKLIESTAWSVQRQFLDEFFKNEDKRENGNRQHLRRYFFEKLCRGGDEKDFGVLTYFIKWSIDSDAELDSDNLRLFGDTLRGYFDDLEVNKVDTVLSTVFKSDKDQVRDRFENEYVNKSEVQWV